MASNRPTRTSNSLESVPLHRTVICHRNRSSCAVDEEGTTTITLPAGMPVQSALPRLRLPNHQTAHRQNVPIIRYPTYRNGRGSSAIAGRLSNISRPDRIRSGLPQSLHKTSVISMTASRSGAHWSRCEEKFRRGMAS
jgi:hypothetical protein